eukprot:SAG31_NODE_40200_length_282_cov_0.978142_1_plen_54_part_10
MPESASIVKRNVRVPQVSQLAGLNDRAINALCTQYDLAGGTVWSIKEYTTHLKR